MPSPELPPQLITSAAGMASLVALYFMHLRYDHPFDAVNFLIALLFLALFLSLTLLDTQQYQRDIQQFRRATGH